MYITIEEMAASFGTNADSLEEHCTKYYNTKDWSYELIYGEEKENLILSLIKFVMDDKQVVGAEYRASEWEKGWKENLSNYRASKSIDDLTPKFLRAGQPVRWQQQFILPNNPTFEKDFVKCFLTWLFTTYFNNASIVEFGCGSGFNIALLSELFPETNLLGTDFAPSAVELIKELSKSNPNIDGRVFDMKRPDYTLVLPSDACVFTSGAIEQLASDFHPFVTYLLKNKPKLCCHIEPTLELYDNNNLVDYTAMMFYQKRGYTKGFLPYLRYLHTQNIIELIAVKRLYFGSLRMEGWNYYIWRPL